MGLVMDYLCRHPNLNDKDLEMRRTADIEGEDQELLATLQAVNLFVYCAYHGFPAEAIAPEPEESTRTFARCLCARLSDFGLEGADPVPDTTAAVAASCEGEFQGLWSFKRVVFPQARHVPPASRALAIWLLAHPEGINDSTAREWVVLRSEGDGQWLVNGRLLNAVRPFAQGQLANSILTEGRIYQSLIASHRSTRQMGTCRTLYRDNTFDRVLADDEVAPVSKGMDYEEDTVLEVQPPIEHHSNFWSAFGCWLLATMAGLANKTVEALQNTEGKTDIFWYLFYVLALGLTIVFPVLGMPLLVFATMSFVAKGIWQGIRKLFMTLVKGYIFGPVSIAIAALCAVLGYIAARYWTSSKPDTLFVHQGGKSQQEKESKVLGDLTAVATPICSALGFVGNQAKHLTDLVRGFDSAHKVTAWIVAAYEGYVSPDSRLASETTKMYVDAFGKKGILYHDGDLAEVLKVMGCSVFTLRAGAECKTGDVYHRMKRSSVRGVPTLRYLLSDSEKLTVKPQKNWLRWVHEGVPDDVNIETFYIDRGKLVLNSGQDNQPFVLAKEWEKEIQKPVTGNPRFQERVDKAKKKQARKDKRKQKGAQVDFKYGPQQQQLLEAINNKLKNDSKGKEKALDASDIAEEMEESQSGSDLVDELAEISKEIEQRTAEMAEIGPSTYYPDSGDEAKEDEPDVDPTKIRSQFAVVPTSALEGAKVGQFEQMRRQEDATRMVQQMQQQRARERARRVADSNAQSEAAREFIDLTREFFPQGSSQGATEEECDRMVKRMSPQLLAFLNRSLTEQTFIELATDFKFYITVKARRLFFERACSKAVESKKQLNFSAWTPEREQRILANLTALRGQVVQGSRSDIRNYKILKVLYRELTTARALGLVALPEVEMADFQPQMRRGGTPPLPCEMPEEKEGEPVLMRSVKLKPPKVKPTPLAVVRGFRYAETNAYANATEETKKWMREYDNNAEKAEQELAQRSAHPMYDYVWHEHWLAVETVTEANRCSADGQVWVPVHAGVPLKPVEKPVVFQKYVGRWVKVLKAARRSLDNPEAGHYAWGYPRSVQKHMDPEEFEEHGSIEEKWKEWSVYGRDFGVQVAEALGRHRRWATLHKWKILIALGISALALILFVWWRKAQRFETQVARAPAANVEKMLDGAEARAARQTATQSYETQAYELIYGDGNQPFVPKDVHQWKSPRVAGGEIVNYRGPAQMATELARAGYTTKPYDLNWVDKSGKHHNLKVRARPKAIFSSQAKLMRERGHEVTNEDERRMGVGENAIRRVKNQVFELQAVNPVAADTLLSLAKIELAEVTPVARVAAEEKREELVLDGLVREARVDIDTLLKENFRTDLLGSSDRADTLIQMTPRLPADAPNAGCMVRVTENVVLCPAHYITHGDAEEDMLAHAKPRSSVFTLGELFKESVQVKNHKGEFIDLQICRRPEAFRGHPRVPMSGTYDPPADGKTERNGWLVGINPRTRTPVTQHVVYCRSDEDGMLWYRAMSEQGLCGALLYDLETGTLVGIHVGAYPAKNPHAAKDKCAAAPITGEIRKQILEADASWGVPLVQRPGVLKVQDFRQLSPTSSPTG